jgi:hypothetical protein
MSTPGTYCSGEPEVRVLWGAGGLCWVGGRWEWRRRWSDGQLGFGGWCLGEDVAWRGRMGDVDRGCLVEAFRVAR